jgi:hypothetical protein
MSAKVNKNLSNMALRTPEKNFDLGSTPLRPVSSLAAYTLRGLAM